MDGVNFVVMGTVSAPAEDVIAQKDSHSAALRCHASHSGPRSTIVPARPVRDTARSGAPAARQLIAENPQKWGRGAAYRATRSGSTLHTGAKLGLGQQARVGKDAKK